jgi:hypothetical protein
MAFVPFHRCHSRLVVLESGTAKKVPLLLEFLSEELLLCNPKGEFEDEQ